MIPDAIRDRFTSNYMSKQCGKTFKSRTVLVAKSSKSQSGRFPAKCITWLSNRKPFLSDFKVIYKVTNSLFLGIFASAIVASNYYAVMRAFIIFDSLFSLN